MKGLAIKRLVRSAIAEYLIESRHHDDINILRDGLEYYYDDFTKYWEMPLWVVRSPINITKLADHIADKLHKNKRIYDILEGQIELERDIKDMEKK